MKIIMALALAAFAVGTFDSTPAAAQCRGNNCRWTNANGQKVQIKRARTYDQCMANGRRMGYNDAQNNDYCRKYF